ncbi:MAG TPA: hypothetical protein VKJ07_20530 [Mycobacteriales bacterium]|nr:hypothetical protein [Mycobacteriales bacterium]
MQGARDNGLRAGNYVQVRELDPRVADDVLLTLRDHGIAAYVMPAEGTVGGSMETRLPTRPMARLYVDDQRVEDARRLVDEEPAHLSSEKEASPDFESSWQQVLTSLQSSPAQMTAPWPEREELTLTERERDYVDPVELEDEHFVPPPAPPLPRLRKATWGALATMAFALFVMVTDSGGRALSVLAFFVFVAAGGSLIYNMRQGPPTDSDEDDGAVV